MSIGLTNTEQRTHSLSALFKVLGTELPISASYTKGDATTPQQQSFDFQETNVLPHIPQTLWLYGDPLALMRYQGVMDPTSTGSTLHDMVITHSQLNDESFDLKADWKIPFVLSDDLSGKFSVGAKTHGITRTSRQSSVHDYLLYGNGQTFRDTLVKSFPQFFPGVNSKASQAGLYCFGLVDPNYRTTNILGYPVGPGFDLSKMMYMQNTYYNNLGGKTGYFVNGPPSFNQYYNDNEHTTAAYVMSEVNIGSDLTLVPGVRYQEERTTINAYHVKLNGANQNGLSGEAPRLAESSRLTPGWYPSVSVKYKVNENISVLGGVFKSMSLPSFGQVTPEIIYTIQGNSITTGNPLLVPSTAWNIDLGANYSSNDVGLVSVNLFYKEISDLIYSMQNYMPFFPYPVVGAPADIWTRLPGPSSNYYDAAWAQQNIASNLTTGIPMNNPSKAYLRGIEISWQTHLYYLPGVLSGVVLDLNAAYMSSRQYYPSFQPVQVGGAGLHKIYNLFYETVGGSLQNQPRATYNAILGWDYMGFSSRFSLRYQQQTLISMDTQFGLQDAFYDNVTMLDISLKQQLFIENLAIFFNASNVNAHVDNYYYSHPAINAIPAGNLPTSQQTYGWAAQLGVSFSY